MGTLAYYSDAYFIEWLNNNRAWLKPMIGNNTFGSGVRQMLFKANFLFFRESARFPDIFCCLQTNFDRRGVEHVFQCYKVKEKIRQSNLAIYGVEYATQCQEVQEKIRQTMLMSYGFEHVLQNAEFAEKASKSAYKQKEYVYPCGTIIMVQGYEPFALRDLVEQGRTCQDLITKRTEVPEIWYKKGEKNARYYCDIFDKIENRIIEVKSTWTYEKDKEDLVLKEKACIDAGYKYELWIYNAKGVRVLV